MMDGCTHEYAFAGIVFKNTGHQLPGSGATKIEYYNWFYCNKCLENTYIKLPAISNLYEHIQFGATPIGE